MPKQAIGAWADRRLRYHERNVAGYGGDFRTEKQTDMAYRGFYASITQVDRTINRIIGTLREEGMLDNTWIMFTSDHGDNIGDHGLWFKANFTRGACNIPLIVVPPSAYSLGNDWIPGQQHFENRLDRDWLHRRYAQLSSPLPSNGNIRERRSEQERELVAHGVEGLNSVFIANGIMLSSFGGGIVNVPFAGNEYETKLQQLIQTSKYVKKLRTGAVVNMGQSFGGN
jgi:hypothetical protein